MDNFITAFWFDPDSDEIISGDGCIILGDIFLPSNNYDVKWVLKGYYFFSQDEAIKSRIESINDEIKELEKRKGQLGKLLS